MPDSRFILIYEPNIRDALFLEDTFGQLELAHPIRVVRHGSELRSYFSGAGIYANRENFPIPSLLILNLSQSLTAVNVLEWLGPLGFMDDFPVIGMGYRVGPRILQRAFDLGMSGYFEKEGDLTHLAKTISELQWMDGWRMGLSVSPDVQLLTKEQFYCVT